MFSSASLAGAALSLAALRTAHAATAYTGDILNGHAVITSLDLADVPSCNVTRYYLRMPDMAGDWAMHLPIYVARGPEGTLESGKKLSLSSSIHGDELTPVRVNQKALEFLEANVDSLNGTVIGIPTLNPSGNYLSQREYFEGGSDSNTDMNRLFPGAAWDPITTPSAPTQYVDIVWRQLWGNTSNVDVAVDMHTAGSGSYAPMWVYADVRAPYVDRMAKLAQPDLIKIDVGEPGSVETTFVQSGIPAITLEMGEAQMWNFEYINRGYEFLLRLMTDLEMFPSNSSTPYEPDLSATYAGKIFQDLPCQYAGFMERLVEILDDVEEGQAIANIRNHWGDVLETVYSPIAARIFEVRRDPAIGPGNGVATLIYNSTLVPDCEAGCVVSGREVPTGDGEGDIRKLRRRK